MEVAIVNLSSIFFNDLADQIIIDYICFKESGESDIDFFLRMSGYTFIISLLLLWIQAVYKFLKLASAVNL